VSLGSPWRSVSPRSAGRRYGSGVPAAGRCPLRQKREDGLGGLVWGCPGPRRRSAAAVGCGRPGCRVFSAAAGVGRGTTADHPTTLYRAAARRGAGWCPALAGIPRGGRTWRGAPHTPKPSKGRAAGRSVLPTAALRAVPPCRRIAGPTRGPSGRIRRSRVYGAVRAAAHARLRLPTPGTGRSRCPRAPAVSAVRGGVPSRPAVPLPRWERWSAWRRRAAMRSRPVGGPPCRAGALPRTRPGIRVPHSRRPSPR